MVGPVEPTIETAEPPRLLRATCAPGLSPWLEREIVELGYEIESTDHTGVEIRARLVDGMRLVLRLRTAYHVLQRFGDIRAKDPEEATRYLGTGTAKAASSYARKGCIDPKL